jgi:hypothetical protein
MTTLDPFSRNAPLRQAFFIAAVEASFQALFSMYVFFGPCLNMFSGRKFALSPALIFQNATTAIPRHVLLPAQAPAAHRFTRACLINAV